MTATKTRSRTKTERFELRLSEDIAHDLDAAAATLGISKSQFACDAVSEKALNVLARSDVTLMDAQVFDRMMASLDHPDPMPGLTEHLADATPYKVR